MPSVALLRVTNAMRRCPAVLEPVSSVESAAAAQVATPRKNVQQVRPPLARGVNPGSSYDPASLRTEGGSHDVEGVATFPWTGRQKSVEYAAGSSDSDKPRLGAWNGHAQATPAGCVQQGSGTPGAQ